MIQGALADLLDGKDLGRARCREVMGVRHRELRIEGVQFHPESVLTPLGPRLGTNFLG